MASSKSEAKMMRRIPPPEIITEILYRLPAKSVGRFRCVSKGWLSLLSDPQFIKTHRKTLNQNHIILLSNDDLLYSHPFNHHEAVLTPTKFHLDSVGVDKFNLCGSCDGFVLVDCGTTLVIYNPTTRDKLFLGLPELGYDMIVIDGEELGDEDFVTDIIHGFWYDSLTDDYKVVIIRNIHYNYPPIGDSVDVHVYSLRSNTWRQVVDSPSDCSCGELRGVFVNGFIHWVGYHSREIVAFSLANEYFTEVPSPELCNHEVNVMCKNDFKLFAFGGKLAIYAGGEVWMMDEYGVPESWTKIVIHGLDETSMVKPMVFDDNNGKILMAGDNRMLVYDIEKENFSKTEYVWTPEDLKVTGTCVESLISLKTIRNP